MTDKEIEEVLEELNGVRPEMLNDEAKRLFNAIMKIADERDELKKIEEAHRELNGELREEVEKLEKNLCGHDEIIARLEEDNTRKDKIIDEIARFIEVNEFDTTLLDEYCPDDYGNCRHPNDSEGCIKCIKEYFTKKASEK